MNIKHFLCALSLYLPSTALVSASAYYLLAPVALCVFYKKYSSNKEFLLATYFFIFSCCLSLSCFFLLGAKLDYYGNFIPLQIGLLASLICSQILNKEVAKYIIILLFFEFIVAFLQYYLGVATFFSFVEQSGGGFNDSSDLLYFRRSFGFGSNSSALAGNALIALVLIEFFFQKTKKRYKLLANGLIFLVLIVAFSRSGLLAFFAFHFVRVFLRLFDRKFKYYLLSIIAISTLLLFFADLDYIVNQMTRGEKGVELTGRDLIWSIYYEQIVQSPVFGNYGLRNYLNIPIYGFQHAHNSIIMILYILGVLPLLIILTPLVIKIFITLNRSLVLLPLIVFSMAQYFLFWGASFADIVLFGVIFSHSDFVLQSKKTRTISLKVGS